MSRRKFSPRFLVLAGAVALLMGACSLEDLVGIPKVSPAERQARMEQAGAWIASDRPVNGDATRGQSIYVEKCSKCHGEEGRTENFGDDGSPRYIGTSANDDPLRFFEIVNFGDVRRWMPGFYDDLTLEQLIDVLSYARTLPTK